MSVSPEQLFISSVIRTRDAAVAELGITPEHFRIFDKEWKWIESFIAQGKPIPSKTAFKAMFPDFQVYQCDDVDLFGGQVIQEHNKKKLTKVLLNAAESLEEDSPNLQKVLKDLQKDITPIEFELGSNSPLDLANDWGMLYEDVQQRVNRVKETGAAGVPTGFKTLDDITGGLQGGWYVVVAARLGQGKTWSLVRMSTTAYIAGYKVLYFTLEQSAKQIALRTHSFLSRQYGKELFKSMDLNRGQGFDLLKYKQFLQDLKDETGKGEFMVMDKRRGKVSPYAIAGAIEAKKPDIVFVDYFGLMEKKGTDWGQMMELSNAVQGVAQEANVPMVCATQVNRMGAQGKDAPDADTIGLTDAIGQDCDLMLTMRQRSQHVMKMKVAKFRHGHGGAQWQCLFDPNNGRYEEITDGEADKQFQLDGEIAD